METLAELEPGKSPDVPQVLPPEPVVEIKASRTWLALNLKEIWAYRELLYFLTWRDVKVRYKQTLLGVVWVVLQPLMTMVITTIFFGKIVRVPSDNLPYALFVFAGLLPWMFFSKAITQSGSSLVGSANLITKVYFPRLIIPSATVLSGLVDYAVSVVVLIGLMIYYGVGASVHLLMFPVLIVLMTILALGVGMWLSALNVKYRDVAAMIPFLVQVGMFATPVYYPSSLIPEKWQWLMKLNPLTGIVENSRAALFNRPFDWLSFNISVGIAVLLLVSSAYVFRRMEKSFADFV
ncbi:MAG: ABC transporter permease [Acidobacteria bacterium]|nr:ABC transporter permease [Acidobacteriota bacterium]